MGTATGGRIFQMLGRNIVCRLTACRFYIFFAAVLLALHGCGADKGAWRPGSRATARPYTVAGHTYYPLHSSRGFVQTGYASWYGRKFHGSKTANGERYNMYSMTAAHKTLPINTILEVRNLENGRTVVVRVNDRGPFVKNRIIDLSYNAALKLGLVNKGTARVRIRAIGQAYRDSSGREKFRELADGRFYVQVGSFASADNAWRLRRKLARRYGKVAVFEHDGFYRVQVFAGTRYDQAVKRAMELEDAGFDSAFIVAR
jgi:rare lipoprotein A